jgi:hypothetical protein
LVPFVLGLAACTGVRVPPVDYTFKTPAITTPLGLPAATDGRGAFAQLFCKVLEHIDRNAEWGDCRQYLELDGVTFGPELGSLPAIVDGYKIVVVAGIFSACLPKDVTIFKQGLAELRRDGLTSIEEIPVSASGGSKENGRLIADYIRKNRDEARPFIAIGYSQGSPDLLQAYADDEVVRSSVAALITVAGAAGGSRLSDGLPRQAVQQLGQLDARLPGCDIKSLEGLNTLRRQDRYNFLSDNRDHLPRSYAIAAKSTLDTTSQILRNGWRTLSAYSIDQDSQVIRDDAVIPGATFLGTALADHWAVALPFQEAHSPLYDRLVDHNKYPRTALLEAAVRFVIRDLEGQRTR